MEYTDRSNAMLFGSGSVGLGGRLELLAATRLRLLSRLEQNAAIARRLKANAYPDSGKGDREWRCDVIELETEWPEMRTLSEMLARQIPLANRLSRELGHGGIPEVPASTQRLLAGRCPVLERRG